MAHSRVGKHPLEASPAGRNLSTLAATLARDGGFCMTQKENYASYRVFYQSTNTVWDDIFGRFNANRAALTRPSRAVPDPGSPDDAPDRAGCQTRAVAPCQTELIQAVGWRATASLGFRAAPRDGSWLVRLKKNAAWDQVAYSFLEAEWNTVVFLKAKHFSCPHDHSPPDRKPTKPRVAGTLRQT